MLPITKKSINVSIIETKPIIIRIPALSIPIHYINTFAFVVCTALVFSFSSVNGPIQEVQMEPEARGIIEICGIQPKAQTVEPTVVSEQSKVIPITQIISDKKVLAFICANQVLSRAYQVQQNTGLKVATIIGQKGVESAWDKSSLCKKTKNYGNIKCFKKHDHHKQGCVQAYDAKEKSNDWYVKVNTNWEGWSIYEQLIDRRFTKAATQDNVYDQLVWLKKKKYATDPNYVSVIWKTINKYNLLKLQEYIDQGYTITTETGKYTLLEP